MLQHLVLRSVPGTWRRGQSWVLPYNRYLGLRTQLQANPGPSDFRDALKGYTCSSFETGLPSTHSPPALASMGQGLEACAPRVKCMFCASGTVWAQ